MDQFDIYGDLDAALIEPLQSEIEKKAVIETAKKEEDKNFREEAEKTIQELKTSNLQLKKNMSLLLATAKSEIERKDQQIKDLRREMDAIIFRKNKGSKTTCEKWSQTDKIESNDNFNKNYPNRFNERPKDPSIALNRKDKDLTETSDRYKKKSPERKHIDSRRASQKDERNGSRSRNYEDDRRRKSTHDRTKSRSPDKHDRSSKDSSRDNLRKDLLKNKIDDKIHSRSHERSKSDSHKRDKSTNIDKERKSVKREHPEKSEDDKRDIKIKSNRKESKTSKNEQLDMKKIEIQLSTENESVNPTNSELKATDIPSTSHDISKQKQCDQKSNEHAKNAEAKHEEKLIPHSTVNKIDTNNLEIPISAQSDQKAVEDDKVKEGIFLNTPNGDCATHEKLSKTEIISTTENVKQSTKPEDDKDDNKKKRDRKDFKKDKTAKNKTVSPKKSKNEPLDPKTIQNTPLDPTENESHNPINSQIGDLKFTESPSTSHENDKEMFCDKITTEQTKHDEVIKMDTNDLPTFKTSKNGDQIMTETAVNHEQKDQIIIEDVNIKSKISLNLSDDGLCIQDTVLNTEIIESIPENENDVPIIKVSEPEDTEIKCNSSKIESVHNENKLDIPKVENKLNLSAESANDSFESTKDNSLNNSMERKSKKRKIVTTEIESDGTVVWTITRKKRKT